MQFPDVVNIQAVTTTFVDVFGREWPNIGHAECLGAGFRWIGTRLPFVHPRHYTVHRKRDRIRWCYDAPSMSCHK